MDEFLQAASQLWPVWLVTAVVSFVFGIYLGRR
jgi:hypothetical protein